MTVREVRKFCKMLSFEHVVKLVGTSGAGANSTAARLRGPLRLRLRIVAIAGLFLLLGVIGFWLMYRQQALATLVYLSGSAERDIASAREEWKPAALEDSFNFGDGARTGRESEARFRLARGAELRLRPSSQIRFKRSLDPESLNVDVELGTADVDSFGAALTLHSEFGELRLERNSSIRLRRTDGGLLVSVEMGGLQFGEQTLSTGERVELEPGGAVAPAPVEALDIDAVTPPVEQAVPELAIPEPKLADGVGYADLVALAGASFVIHDPRPPTAVGFPIAKLCNGGAELTSGDRRTGDRRQVNLTFPVGTHRYEIRCLTAPETVAASGSIRVLQDAGTRKLPSFAPTAQVTTDGRRYTVLYQYRLPVVTVSWPSAPPAKAYRLMIDGRTVRTSKPAHTVSGLRRGTHTFTYSAVDSPRQSRTSTVEVVFDTQAPAARLSEPSVGVDAQGTAVVNGQAMPGWQVSVAGKPLDVSGENTFSVRMDSGATVLPIQVSHPSRGTHYYLRRSAQAR